MSAHLISFPEESFEKFRAVIPLERSESSLDSQYKT